MKDDAAVKPRVRKMALTWNQSGLNQSALMERQKLITESKISLCVRDKQTRDVKCHLPVTGCTSFVQP